jgi:hypothetical protein
VGGPVNAAPLPAGDKRSDEFSMDRPSAGWPASRATCCRDMIG